MHLGGHNNDNNTKFDSETLGFRSTHVRIRVTLGKLFNFPYLSFLMCKMGIRTGGHGGNQEVCCLGESAYKSSWWE